MRLLWLGVLAGLAGPAVCARAGSGQDCAAAAARAEQRWALPGGLLLAIGAVESGQRDPGSGELTPWPWTANAAGTGYVFASRAEAVAVVRFLTGRGIASVDIGCFQVNLLHHPAAFASLADGFDAAENADYAARFLRDLRDRTGSWTGAVAAYHSAEWARGAAYARRVLDVWRSLRGASRMAPAGADPHAPLWAQAGQGIPVYTPATLPAALRRTMGGVTGASP